MGGGHETFYSIESNDDSCYRMTFLVMIINSNVAIVLSGVAN